MNASQQKPLTLPQIRRCVANSGCLIIGVLITVSIVVLLAYQNCNPAALSRRDYAGKIVDKQMRALETQQGSFLMQYLIIEEENGHHSRVFVLEETYARAQIGMWIQISEKGIVLLSSKPETKP